MSPTGVIKSRISGNYTIAYDLSRQSEGKYNVEVNIRDFFQNQTNKTFERIALDNTPPTVANIRRKAGKRRYGSVRPGEPQDRSGR